MDLNRLSSNVGNAASKVYGELGPFLSPSIYRSCMTMELRSMCVRVKSQVRVPVFYRGKKVEGEKFEIDLLVENELIVEILSLEGVLEFHRRQMLMYLQAARKPSGLLINFGERLLVTAFEGSSALNPSASYWAEEAKLKRRVTHFDPNPLKNYSTVTGITKNVNGKRCGSHSNGHIGFKRIQRMPR
jgi:GxxExxY protein